MEKSLEQHSVYKEEDLEIKTPEDLEEAKKIEDVTNKKGSAERMKQFGEENNDEQLISAAEEQIDKINDIAKGTELLSGAEGILDRLKTIVMIKDSQTKNALDTHTEIEKIEKLKQELENLDVGAGAIKEIDKEISEKKLRIENIKRSSLFSYATKDLQSAIEILTKIQSTGDSDEEKKVLIEMLGNDKPFIEKYEQKSKEMYRKASVKHRGRNSGVAARSYMEIGNQDKAIKECLGVLYGGTGIRDKDEICDDINMIIEYAKKTQCGKVEKWAIKKLIDTKHRWGKSSGDEFEDRAKLYEEMGETKKAEELRELAREEWLNDIENDKKHTDSECFSNEYKSMAKTYEKLGETENAVEMWKKEANEQERKEWEDGDNYEYAAEAYEKAGDVKKAEEMHGKYKEISEVLVKKYEKDKKYKMAAYCFRKRGDKDKEKEMWGKYADELLRKGMEVRENPSRNDLGGGPSFIDAAKMSDRIDLLHEVLTERIQGSIKYEDYDIAANYYREMGNTEKEVEMWEKEVVKSEKEQECYAVAVAYKRLSKIVKENKAREIIEKLKECAK